jgi:hypothetical protein
MAALKNPRNPSPRQVLLGLFILFQIAFLVTSNFIGFIQWAPPKFLRLAPRDSDDRKNRRQLMDRVAPGFAEERGHLWQWGDLLETNLRRYSQLTGQDQAWSLFAPGVHTETGWPCLLLLWDDPPAEGQSIPGTVFAFDARNGFNVWADWNKPAFATEMAVPATYDVGLLAASNPIELLMLDAVYKTRKADVGRARSELLLSVNEPNDIYDFVRIGKARFRRFEGKLYFNTQADRETPDELAARMTREVRDGLREYHDLAHEYLRMRYKDWKREHPTEPRPTQVILLNRLYHIRGPKDDRHDQHHHHPGWDGPFVVPVARWMPEGQRNPDYYELEPFNFADQRFYPMTK